MQYEKGEMFFCTQWLSNPGNTEYRESENMKGILAIDESEHGCLCNIRSASYYNWVNLFFQLLFVLLIPNLTTALGMLPHNREFKEEMKNKLNDNDINENENSNVLNVYNNK